MVLSSRWRLGTDKYGKHIVSAVGLCLLAFLSFRDPFKFFACSYE
jgi:hypothetical protein